jgi:hydrogenase maturation protease
MSVTLILGVGNTLLSDEGAGVHAMCYLRDHGEAPDDTIFIDAGTLSFVLADDIASATNLIIFDAAQLDADPGTVRIFEGTEFDEFLKSGKRSVHEVGFADLMDIARLQDCLPDRRALIGIQPGEFGWGSKPGDDVMKALPEAARLARELIEEWRAAAVPKAVNQ